MCTPSAASNNNSVWTPSATSSAVCSSPLSSRSHQTIQQTERGFWSRGKPELSESRCSKQQLSKWSAGATIYCRVIDGPLQANLMRTLMEWSAFTRLSRIQKKPRGVRSEVTAASHEKTWPGAARAPSVKETETHKTETHKLKSQRGTGRSQSKSQRERSHSRPAKHATAAEWTARDAVTSRLAQIQKVRR